MLVYAATGEGPFLRRGEEASAAQLLYRIAHEEPRLDDVPPALRPVLAACLRKAPQSRPTAPELMERLGPDTGEWVTVPPPGLAEDLAAREGELRGLLEVPTAAVPPPVAPATPVAPAIPGFGPPPVYGPAAGTGTGPVPFVPGGAAVPAAARPRTAVVAGGVLAVVAAVAVAVWMGGAGDGQAGDGTSPPSVRSPSASRSSSGSAAANALPASWVGTWQGTGLGSTAGDGVFNARTTKVSVTLTLHAARRGDLVGRQVSHVTEAGSGNDIGCTETLRLQETHATSMVFQAVTSTPTDPSLGVVCRAGNVYTLAKDGADTLALGDEGSQTAGSPAHLRRVT